MKNKPIITVITPTTGKESLVNLIGSMKKQGVPLCHIVLWDEFKENEVTPLQIERFEKKDDNYSVINIDMKFPVINGNAKGSSLRSIGLMAAFTDIVTFADDDIMWEDDHLIQMIESLSDKNWVFCKRKIWYQLDDGQYEYLGIDEFESVGEDAKTPYKMVDNNCMMFRRKYGSSAACLYRETTEYNDDRLMYNFLMKYAGVPNKTNNATINQVCPKKLEQFFRINCTK